MFKPSVKINTPDIVWHGEDLQRILSLDFYPFNNTFVTGGTSQDGIGYLKTWEYNVNSSDNTISVTYKRDLVEHTAPVNCCKFSPNGKFLASGSDDKKIVLWTLRLGTVAFGSEERDIVWCKAFVLRGHNEDVLDLKWSSDSRMLASASIDQNGILWNAEKGELLQMLPGHTHYVQGVAFDPLCEFIATQSCDRTVRVWKQGKKGPAYNHEATIKKLAFNLNNSKKKGKQGPAPSGAKNPPSETAMEIESEGVQTQDQPERQAFRLFLDESHTTFFRRCDWSPDGSFLLLPAGQFQTSPTASATPAVLVYKRTKFSKPCLRLGTNNKAALCIKFCPLLFELDEKNSFSMFDVPYKYIFAVMTIDTVMIYSSQSLLPIVVVGQIHFASLTDISWANGPGSSSVLAVSSSDGFCTFLVIDNKELGRPLPLEGIQNEKVREVFALRKNYYNEHPVSRNNESEMKPMTQTQVVQQPGGPQVVSGIVTGVNGQPEKKKIVVKVLQKFEATSQP